MATNIEILATTDQLINVGEFKKGFFIFLSSYSIFKKILVSEDSIQLTDMDGSNLSNITKLEEDGQIFHGLIEGEICFSIQGPNEIITEETPSNFDVEQIINDRPHFDLKLLPNLVKKATEANSSYVIQWSGGSKKRTLYSFVAILAICELLDGVVINVERNELESGTYLTEGWKLQLLNYIKSISF